MDWLNYHHLLYFWMVTREGSLTGAGKQLQVSQPTISNQIKELEAALGEPLFTRVGRRMVLTESGQVVASYAADIFSLGQEMIDTIKDRPTGRPLRLRVGVTDVMPKLMTRLVLEPVAGLAQNVRLICVERKVEELLVDLAAFQVDVVLSDRPIESEGTPRVINHLLAESGISFLGSRALARRFKSGFPRSLDGAPFYLPTESTVLRRSLNLWMEELGIKPVVIGEFEDAALLQVYGQTGRAVFPALTVLEREICRREEVTLIGRAKDVRERFYAITPERRQKHPAVVALCQATPQKSV